MSNANVLELSMLALINAERAAAGLDPLRPITLLNEAAEIHSQWMLEADQFSHSGEGGSSPSDRMAEAGYPFEGNSMALENIGWQSLRGEEGAEDDVAAVHQSLMNSPSHRANVLDPVAEDVGIGIETGTFSSPNGDFEALIVTQVFGTTDADISAWVDPGTGAADGDVVPEDDMIVEDDVFPEEDMIAEDDTTDETLVEEMPEETPDPVDPLDPVPVDAELAEDSPDGEGDDVPDDTEDESDVAMMDIPLPCGLTGFTVDLSDAFTFKQEGDQWIWETSEEQLVDTFMAAFEDWAANADMDGADTAEGEMDIADLMVDGAEDPLPMTFGTEKDIEDLLSETCI